MKSRPALLALLVLLWSPTGLARDDATLETRIEALVAKAELGGTLGIHVIKLSDGKTLYAKNSTTPLNPASNLKLLTAAAALRRLGPEFRMWTGFYGHLRAGQVAELVVRGYGDPSLRRVDLIAVADDMKAKGVTRVQRIVIDGSYFDAQVLPPAFDQQPDEASSFRAAISAIAVDRNAYVLSVRPGAKVGAPASVSVWADGYIKVDSRVSTVALGRIKVQAEQVATPDRRLKLTVRGTLPKSRGVFETRRRVDDPLAYAGHAIAKALSEAGIGGPKTVAFGTGKEGLPLLAAQRSRPLSQVLYSVGKWSDNFAAEMLVKVMGTEAGRPGSSQNGVEVIVEALQELGVSVEGLTLVNGSGLFVGNEVAPFHITQTLRAMHGDSTLSSEYIAHLSIAGIDGTLSKRLTDLPRSRMVRAKTGTLADVIALSGYVFGESSGDHIAFSLLLNGIKGHQREARDLADNIVRTLANELASKR